MVQWPAKSLKCVHLATSGFFALTLFFKTSFLDLKRGFPNLLSFLLVGVVYQDPVLPRPDCKVDTFFRKFVTSDGEAGQDSAGDQSIHDIFKVVRTPMTQLDVHILDLGEMASELSKRLQSSF